MRFIYQLKAAALVGSGLMLMACGTDTLTPEAVPDGGQDAATADSDAGDDGGAPVATFSIGGTVSGLLGKGLVLQNGAGDDLPVAANGSFTFPTKLASGESFAVTIKTQPTAPSQTCTVSGGSGTVVNGNVTTVRVNCRADEFAVGGSVTGLSGTGLTLQNNGGDDLVVSSNGTFAFATPLISGSPYAITVKTQPSTPSQTCTVTAGTGHVGAAEIKDVAINCVTNEYTVGGTVVGLTGSGLVLEVNGGDSFTVATSGPFTFATPIASGAAFTVTVSAQPSSSPKQTCLVVDGTGTVGAANVSNVVVNCATDKFVIGGTVSGLGGTVVLQNNDGDDLSVATNGPFSFTTKIENGASYAVTIKTQPTGERCTVTSASGVVGLADVTTVVVSCEILHKVLLVTGDAFGTGLDTCTKAGLAPFYATVDAVAAPSADDLATHDRVFVFNNGSHADPTTLGDQLADYFDANGHVVEALFNIAGRGTLGGRWASGGYSLISGNYSATAGMESLGTIFEPESPLLKDVATFSSLFWPDGSVIINGGTVVAAYANGQPAIVRGVKNGRNRVDLGLVPGCAFISGNAYELIRNALDY